MVGHPGAHHLCVKSRLRNSYSVFSLYGIPTHLPGSVPGPGVMVVTSPGWWVLSERGVGGVTNWILNKEQNFPWGWKVASNTIWKATILPYLLKSCPLFKAELISHPQPNVIPNWLYPKFCLHSVGTSGPLVIASAFFYNFFISS